MNLAVLLSATGEVDRARPIASAALEERMEYLGPGPTTPQAIHNGWGGHIFAPHIFPLIGATAGNPIIYGLLGPDSQLTPEWVLKTFRSAGTRIQRFEDSVALTFDHEITAIFEWLNDEHGVSEAMGTFEGLPPEKRSAIPSPPPEVSDGFRILMLASEAMSGDEVDITIMFVEELEKFGECVFFAREGSFSGPTPAPIDSVSSAELAQIIRAEVKPVLQKVGFTRFNKDRYQLLDGPKGLYAEVLPKISANMQVQMTLRVFYRDLMSEQEIQFNSTSKGRFLPQRPVAYGAALVQNLERICPASCATCSGSPSRRGHRRWTLSSTGLKEAQDLAVEIADHVQEQFVRVISTIKEGSR